MKRLGSPLEWLTKLTDANAELVGDEEIDGKKTKVYRLKKIEYPLGVGPLDESKVNRLWIDAESGLPVKIVVNYFDAENNRPTHDVYANFQWNEPIAEALFSLAVPDGFKAAKEMANGAA